MSLLLTKTCEYAILVSIQQGRYFPTNTSIKIETELDLKLPPSIDDLIPTKTLISSPIAKVDTNGTCSFNVSLVYFVSFKQLSRLRRNEATATLAIKSLDADTTRLTLHVSEAKEVIPQSEHKLDHIYKFVSDKGAWCTIPKTRQQLKVGLFYVAMPDNHGNSSNNSIVLNTPCIQLRSPPPTPIMPKRLTATNNNRKKTLSSILGTSSNSVITCATSVTKKLLLNDEKKEKKKSTDKPALRRAKSSLVDLNIEELAEALKKLKVFPSSSSSAASSSSYSSAKPTLSSTTTTTPPPLTPLPITQSYHQIGKGSLQYTFYFKIVYVDHFKQTLLRKSTTPNMKKINQLKKPYFSYSFLTHYNLSPVASINSAQQQGKYCFHLRGHRMDIQNWLNAQSQIELSYIIMDKFTKESVGKSIVSLKSISKDKLSDKLYTVTDINDDEIISKLTVRSGIMTGWHKEEEYDIDDPWDMFENKKMRHHSQSSVPTLLTSSTTCSTKSSSNHVPSISYIQRPSSKKTKYMTSTFFK